VSPAPFTSVQLKGLVEKPSPDAAPSNLAILGRYVLPPSILNLLENTVAGVGGEIQLTDALDELLKSEGLNAFKTDAASFDCGNKQGFLGANVAVGIQDPEIKAYLKALIESSNIKG
jgi:UTP--glucose-1-phosphate uridylyltransferase